jgi:ribosomal protein S18 acetylase RimI-like enzyme
MERRTASHTERPAGGNASAALYKRMEENLIASWAEYAAGAAGAHIERSSGASVAVFPRGPERGVYNNALLARALADGQAVEAIDAVEHAYSTADVHSYAVWAHEEEAASIAELETRGYHVDIRTRAMAMRLETVPVPDAELELVEGEWHAYLAMLTQLDAPPGLLVGVDGSRFEVLIGALDGVRVAAALAYDHAGDCGIYNVGTITSARRRGFGTALTALHLHRAHERGCITASLQATEMAEGIYARLGFRDLGRFVEYVP